MTFSFTSYDSGYDIKRLITQIVPTQNALNILTRVFLNCFVVKRNRIVTHNTLVWR